MVRAGAPLTPDKTEHPSPHPTDICSHSKRFKQSPQTRKNKPLYPPKPALYPRPLPVLMRSRTPTLPVKELDLPADAPLACGRREIVANLGRAAAIQAARRQASNVARRYMSKSAKARDKATWVVLFRPPLATRTHTTSLAPARQSPRHSRNPCAWRDSCACRDWSRTRSQR